MNVKPPTAFPIGPPITTTVVKTGSLNVTTFSNITASSKCKKCRHDASLSHKCEIYQTMFLIDVVKKTFINLPLYDLIIKEGLPKDCLVWMWYRTGESHRCAGNSELYRFIVRSVALVLNVCEKYIREDKIDIEKSDKVKNYFLSNMASKEDLLIFSNQNLYLTELEVEVFRVLLSIIEEVNKKFLNYAVKHFRDFYYIKHVSSYMDDIFENE